MTKEQAERVADILCSQEQLGETILKVLIYIPGSGGEYIELETGKTFTLSLKE